MSDEPLLDKEKGFYSELKGDSFLEYEDVVESLRKFKSAILFKDYDRNDCDICGKRIRLGYAVITSGGRTDEFYCKTCWFEECFGELPKEKDGEEGDKISCINCVHKECCGRLDKAENATTVFFYMNDDFYNGLRELLADSCESYEKQKGGG